ncbi:hypothetical protein [Streptomyces cupreus]|uniref:Uncharacterized protein n=1 Tax=Streptomyces cupreus TaxID=2759956 RepID=A0A7X1J7W8_9ACTN|nr:hypothetical protein [Streptomyces cupreus]MBC2905359.1 hypothetical protein [Streptomyces cupreus]
MIGIRRAGPRDGVPEHNAVPLPLSDLAARIVSATSTTAIPAIPRTDGGPARGPAAADRQRFPG